MHECCCIWRIIPGYIGALPASFSLPAVVFDGLSTGFLGEMWFTGPNGKYWVFTTQVSIIPTTFPFPDCVGAGCYGGLV